VLNKQKYLYFTKQELNLWPRRPRDPHPPHTLYTCVNDIDFPSLNSAPEVMAAEFTEDSWRMTSLNNGIVIGLLRLLRGNNGTVMSVPFDRFRCCGMPLPADEELLHIIDYGALHSASLSENGSVCLSVVLRQRGKRFGEKVTQIFRKRTDLQYYCLLR
jgi:hypothetical protein